ncbi:hypothetical protein TNCV_4369151 [Trichonephila clavipes]|nr:hypothetical protein TNCV_4369151 [Trichonephila clavipes]
MVAAIHFPKLLPGSNKISVPLEGRPPCMRTTTPFRDGSRNFEPSSSDEDDTQTGTSLLTSILTGGRLSLDRFNVHLSPLHGGPSAILGLNSGHVDHHFTAATREGRI